MHPPEEPLALRERSALGLRIAGLHDENDPVEGLGREYFGRLGSVLVRIYPPLLGLLAFASAATGFLLLFASLPIGLLWRSRRYLADATAVQLTRNPTGLTMKPTAETNPQPPTTTPSASVRRHVARRFRAWNSKNGTPATGRALAMSNREMITPDAAVAQAAEADLASGPLSLSHRIQTG